MVRPAVVTTALRRLGPAGLAAAGMGVVALLLALPPLLLQDGLAGVHGYGNGVGYDDGVYTGAALRLVHGQLPYRDFVFVHPPGIALLMAPVALLGDVLGSRDAMVGARLLTVLAVAASAVLAGLAVRHRGWFVAATAGLLVAVSPAVLPASHTLLLEPWLVLFGLLGLALLLDHGSVTTSPRMLLLAGLPVGFSGAVKLWGVFLAVPLLLVVAVCRGPRNGLRYAAGLTLGFAVPVGLVAVWAPRAFFHDVFAAQLSRATGSAGGRDLPHRLAVSTGFVSFDSTARAAVVLAVPVVLLAVATGLVALRRRSMTSGDVAVVALALGSTLCLLLPTEYFEHYPLFASVFAALLVAVLGSIVLGPVLLRLPRLLLGLVGAVALGGLVVLQAVPRSEAASLELAEANDPGASIAALVPAGACVLFDNPSLAVVADRFVPTRSGCPAQVDPFGLWLTEADGSVPYDHGPVPAAFRDLWSGWLRHADYLVLSFPGSSYLPFDAALQAQVAKDYVLLSSVDHAYVYARVDAHT